MLTFAARRVRSHSDKVGLDGKMSWEFHPKGEPPQKIIRYSMCYHTTYQLPRGHGLVGHGGTMNPLRTSKTALWQL